MPHEILFSLLDEILNTKKMNTQEWKERKFEKKKSKRNRVSCFNIYIFVFAFLSSIVVEVKWNVCFWNTFHLLCLTAATFMKWFEIFKNNVITFGWRLFAYFYKISNKCYCLIFLIDLFTWTIINSASQKRRSLNQTTKQFWHINSK